MRRRLLSVLLVIAASAPVAADCIDATISAHSTVSISRLLDDQDTEVEPGVLGILGTGWFLSPTSLVTVEHVTEAMNLSEEIWKPVELRKDGTTQSISVRLRRVAGARGERIALLELQAPFSGAKGLALRTEPLVPDEPLVSLAYPGGGRRAASGRFVQYGAGDTLTGTALLEMYDGNDRLVLDHGASGAPVLDCTGRVVAVVSNLMTTTMQFLSRTVRISTAWGDPNVVSLPVQALQDGPGTP